MRFRNSSNPANKIPIPEPIVQAILESDITSIEDLVTRANLIAEKRHNQEVPELNEKDFYYVFELFEKYYTELMTKIVEKDLPEDIKLLESLMMADLALTKSVITGAGVDLLYMLECFTYTFDHPFLDFITHYIMGVSNHSNRMGNDTMGSCRELVVEYIEKTGALDIDRAHDKNHISELVSELKNSIYSEIAALSDYFSEGFTLPEASKIFEKSTTAEIKKIFSKGKSNISLKKRLELSADLNVGIFFEKYLTNKDKTIFHNIYTIFSFGKGLNLEDYDYPRLTIPKAKDWLYKFPLIFEEDPMGEGVFNFAAQIVGGNDRYRDDDDNRDQGYLPDFFFKLHENRTECNFVYILKQFMKDPSAPSTGKYKEFKFEAFFNRYSYTIGRFYHFDDYTITPEKHRDQFKLSYELLESIIFDDKLTSSLKFDWIYFFEMFYNLCQVDKEIFKGSKIMKVFEYLDNLINEIVEGKDSINTSFFEGFFYQIPFEILGKEQFQPLGNQILDFFKSRDYLTNLSAFMDNPKVLEAFRKHPLVFIRILEMLTSYSRNTSEITESTGKGIEKFIDFFLTLDLNYKAFKKFNMIDFMNRSIISKINPYEITKKIAEFYLKKFSNYGANPIEYSYGDNETAEHFKKLLAIFIPMGEKAVETIESSFEELLNTEESKYPERLAKFQAETKSLLYGPINMMAEQICNLNRENPTFGKDLEEEVHKVQTLYARVMCNPGMAFLNRKIYEGSVNRYHRNFTRKHQLYSTLMKNIFERLKTVASATDEEISTIDLQYKDWFEEGEEFTRRRTQYQKVGLVSSRKLANRQSYEFMWLLHLIAAKTNINRFSSEGLLPETFGFFKDYYPIIMKYLMKVAYHLENKNKSERVNDKDRISSTSEFISDIAYTFYDYTIEVIAMHNRDRDDEEKCFMPIANFNEILAFVPKLIAAQKEENYLATGIICCMALDRMIADTQKKDRESLVIPEEFMTLLNKTLAFMFNELSNIGDKENKKAKIYETVIRQSIKFYKIKQEIDKETPTLMMDFLKETDNIFWVQNFKIIDITFEDIYRFIKNYIENCFPEKEEKSEEGKKNDLFEEVKKEDSGSTQIVEAPSASSNTVVEETKTSEVTVQTSEKSQEESSINVQPNVNETKVQSPEDNAPTPEAKQLTEPQQAQTPSLNDSSIQPSEISINPSIEADLNSSLLTLRAGNSMIKGEDQQSGAGPSAFKPKDKVAVDEKAIARIKDFIEKFDWTITMHKQSFSNLDPENLFTNKYPKILEETNAATVDLALSLLKVSGKEGSPDIIEALKALNLFKEQPVDVTEPFSIKSLNNISQMFLKFFDNFDPIKKEDKYKDHIKPAVIQLGLESLIHFCKSSVVNYKDEETFKCWEKVYSTMAKVFQIYVKTKDSKTDETKLNGYLIELLDLFEKYIIERREFSVDSDTIAVPFDYINENSSQNPKLIKTGLEYLMKWIKNPLPNGVNLLFGYLSIFGVHELSNPFPYEVMFEYLIRFKKDNKLEYSQTEMKKFLSVLEPLGPGIYDFINKHFKVMSDSKGELVFKVKEQVENFLATGADLFTTLKTTINPSAKSYIEKNIETIIYLASQYGNDNEKGYLGRFYYFTISFLSILQQNEMLIPYALFTPLDKKLFEVEFPKKDGFKIFIEKLKSGSAITFIDIIIYFLASLDNAVTNAAISFFSDTADFIKIKIGDKKKTLGKVINEKISSVFLEILGLDDPSFLDTDDSKKFWIDYLNFLSYTNDMSENDCKEVIIKKLLNRILDKKFVRKFDSLRNTQFFKRTLRLIETNNPDSSLYEATLEAWDPLYVTSLETMTQTLQDSSSAFDHLIQITPISQSPFTEEQYKESLGKKSTCCKPVNAGDLWTFINIDDQPSNNSKDKKKKKPVRRRHNDSDSDDDRWGFHHEKGRGEDTSAGEVISNIKNVFEQPNYDLNEEKASELFKKLKEAADSIGITEVQSFFDGMDEEPRTEKQKAELKNKYIEEQDFDEKENIKEVFDNSITIIKKEEPKEPKTEDIKPEEKGKIESEETKEAGKANPDASEKTPITIENEKPAAEQITETKTGTEAPAVEESKESTIASEKVEVKKDDSDEFKLEIEDEKIAKKDTDAEEVDSIKKESSKPEGDEKKVEEESKDFKFFINEPVKTLQEFKDKVKNFRKNQKQTLEVILLAKINERKFDKNVSKAIFDAVLSDKSLFEKSSLALSIGNLVSIEPDEELKTFCQKARKEFERIVEDWDSYAKAQNIPVEIKATESTISTEKKEEKKGDEDSDADRPRRPRRNHRNRWGDVTEEENDEDKGDDVDASEKIFMDYKDVKFPVPDPKEEKRIKWIRTTFEEKAIKEKQKLDEEELKKMKNGVYLYNDDEIFHLLQYFFTSNFNANEIYKFFGHPVNEIKILDFLFLICSHPKILEEDNTEFPFKTLIRDINSSPKKFWENFLLYLEFRWAKIISINPIYLGKFNSEKIKAFKAKINYRDISRFKTLFALFSDIVLNNSYDPPYITLSRFLKVLTAGGSDRNRRRRDDDNDPVEIPLTSDFLVKLFGKLGKNTEDVKLVSTLFENLYKMNPTTFISDYSIVSDVFVPFINSLAKSASGVINLLRQHLKEEKPIKIEDALKGISETDLRFSELLLKYMVKGYTEVLVEPKGKVFESKNERSNKAKITQEMFERTSEILLKHYEDLHSQDFKYYFIEIYEILELLARAKLHEKENIILNDLVSLALLNGTLLYIQEKLKLEVDTFIPSLPELKSAVSANFDEEMTVPTLGRSFSAIKSETSVDLATVFINFASKYKTAISEKVISENNESEDNRRRRRRRGEENTTDAKELMILIERFPWLFSSQAKREILLQRMANDTTRDNHCQEIRIDRKMLVYSFAKCLAKLSREELIGSVEVSFVNEQGIDQGGPRAELFTKTAKELFSPEAGLFKLTPNQNTVEINPLSHLVPNHLLIFQFAGIIVGKAILEKIPVNVNFNRALLKKLLGLPLVIGDLDDIDSDLSKTLQWTLDNDVDDIGVNFVYTYKDFVGDDIVVELIPDGANIDVSNANKIEYVKKFCDMRMHKLIEPQLDAFVKGFQTILPREFTYYLRSYDLDLMIAGVQKIDLADMKAHFKFERDGDKNTDQAKWLFEILEEYTQEQLSSFLQFVTGLSKVPVGGFKNKPMTMELTSNKPDSMPIAHTCYWQIDVPKYPSKEVFAQKLLYALYEASEGFEIR